MQHLYKGHIAPEEDDTGDREAPITPNTIPDNALDLCNHFHRDVPGGDSNAHEGLTSAGA